MRPVYLSRNTEVVVRARCVDSAGRTRAVRPHLARLVGRTGSVLGVLGLSRPIGAREPVVGYVVRFPGDPRDYRVAHYEIEPLSELPS